jgi:hypothetical protein
MATIVTWSVPIRASWCRATELVSLHHEGTGMVLALIEEGTENRWRLSFGTVQAARFTTEECAASLLGSLPSRGGFFEVKDSPWLKELGQGSIGFLEKAQHFIICCYDEVVEVVATDPRFALESSENAPGTGSR